MLYGSVLSNEALGNARSNDESSSELLLIRPAVELVIYITLLRQLCRFVCLDRALGW